MHDKIFVKGAREHNLKNVDVTIPRDNLTVFTGISGSGKSSLAFDTIYAEGQRRYVEISFLLCPAVFGADGKAGCGLYRRAFPSHFHRPKDHLQKPPLHCGHRDGDLRLPAPAVCAHRHSPLPQMRQGDQAADHRPDRGPGDELCRMGTKMQILAPGGPGAQRRTRQRCWRTRAKAVLSGCGSMAACTIFPKRSSWKKTKSTTSKWWWTASRPAGGHPAPPDRFSGNGCQRFRAAWSSSGCSRDRGEDSLFPELRLSGLRHLASKS